MAKIDSGGDMNFDSAMNNIENFGRGGMKLGLERMRALLKIMGNPQRGARFAHVAGTNGKGSTSAMLAKILESAGYKTGLFTSPHLYKINERFQINDKNIADENFAEIIEKIIFCAEKMCEKPTQFEVFTAAAFEFFHRENCDIAVIEVGLGGRLDATNVIDAPEACAITSIGLDHTDILGGTIEEIAAEKAAIIKENCDVVLYDQPENIVNIVDKKCLETHSRLHKTNFSSLIYKDFNLERQIFSLPGYENVNLNLLGLNQPKNATVSIKAAEILRSMGWKIPKDAIFSGLKTVRWPFRFEVLRANPTIILDGAHNPQCARSLAKNLRHYFDGRKISFIFGALADKNYSEMIGALAPLAADFSIVPIENSRAASIFDLEACVRSHNLAAKIFKNLQECLCEKLSNAAKTDVLCVCGSLYLAEKMIN